MNAKNLLTLQSVLLFLLIVVVALGIALPYIVPPRTAANTAAIVPTEITLSTPTPVPTASITQWEYLSVDYAQHQILDALYNSDADVYRYEIVSAPEPYGSRFTALLTDGCSITGDILFDTEAQNCIGRNYIGRENVLSVLGVDGWELIAFDNHSTEYSYQVDMLFKRPIYP